MTERNDLHNLTVLASSYPIGLVINAAARQVYYVVNDAFCHSELCRKTVVDAMPDFPQAAFYTMAFHSFVGNYTQDRLKQSLITAGGLMAGILTTEIAWPLLVHQPIYNGDIVTETAGMLGALLLANYIDRPR